MQIKANAPHSPSEGPRPEVRQEAQKITRIALPCLKHTHVAEGRKHEIRTGEAPSLKQTFKRAVA